MNYIIDSEYWKPKIQPNTMIGDVISSEFGKTWICGTDRNSKLTWIEGPLQPRTR